VPLIIYPTVHSPNKEEITNDVRSTVRFDVALWSNEGDLRGEASTAVFKVQRHIT